MIRLKIIKAKNKDLPAIVEIMVVGSSVDHTDFVKQSVKAGKCLVALISDNMAGFGILGNTLFFGRNFIELLIVHPEYRRQGVATAIIRRMESLFPIPELFTSTNQSNVPAQKTYEANGFIRSGFIENLDVDDPEIIYFKLLDGTNKGIKNEQRHVRRIAGRAGRS